MAKLLKAIFQALGVVVCAWGICRFLYWIVAEHSDAIPYIFVGVFFIFLVVLFYYGVEDK